MLTVEMKTEHGEQQRCSNQDQIHCFYLVIFGVAALIAPQAGSYGELRERLCVLKEGLCEAGSWLAAEGRVTVRNWVATAAQYLWLDVGGRRRQSSLDEM